MEIRPQVYLIDAVKGSNVYLLVDRKLVLIDTGPPGSAEVILEFIASLGRRPEELSHILITHGHADHIGSLWQLRARTGAKAVAYESSTAADLTVSDNVVCSYMGGLHMIHTPGHTLDSMSLLLEKKGVLFVGDAINGMKGSPFLSLLRNSEEDWAILQPKLAQYRVDVCCFGHGPPQYLDV